MTPISWQDFFVFTRYLYMICTKCNIDKPIEQYDSYFHSTQNKQRTRKYCKDCYREQKRKYRESIKEVIITQPVLPEQPTIDNSTNPDYCLCNMCQQYVHNDNWYWSKRSKTRSTLTRSAYCKKCTGEKYGREYKQKLREKGGSEYVHAKPNVYADDAQKELVFEVMTSFGYIYNQEFGVWTKPDVKELIDGKIVFPMVKPHKRTRESLTPEQIDKIHQYHNEGINFMKIARLIDRHPSTVYKRLQNYEPTFKTRRS